MQVDSGRSMRSSFLPFARPSLGEEEIREVPGSGHLANLERPDEFNTILREFLSRV